MRRCKQVRTSTALAVTILLLLNLGCGKKAKTPLAASNSRPKAMPAIPVPLGYTETGLASWYGHPYHGRQAADGEIYDMETLVAAHRTLPFQTWVRVTLLSTNRTVDVRIIDRGPFVDGRIIDVSHAAAIGLGLIGPGVGQVTMEVIKTAANPEASLFAVQVGVFREEANADRAVVRMSELYGSARKVLRPASPSLWRVLAGKVTTQEDAELLAKKIREEQNIPEAFIVRLDP